MIREQDGTPERAFLAIQRAQVRRLCASMMCVAVLGGLAWISLRSVLQGRGTSAATSCQEPNGMPCLKIPEGTLDLGEGDPGQVLEGKLKLKNTGSADLTFELRPSCGCTSVHPQRGVIGPSGTLAVTVGVKLLEYSNSERTVTVKVESNDPVTPSMQCILVGRSRASVDVSPRALYFGRVPRTKMRDAWRNLNVLDSRGSAIRDPSSVAITTEQQNVVYSWVKSTDDSYCLRVSLAPTFAGSELRDTLDVVMRDAIHSFRVPIYAQVVESASLIPATVFLSKSATPDNSRALTFFVQSEEPLGELTRVSAFRGAAVEDCGETAPGLRRLRLTVQGPALPDGLTTIDLAFKGYSKPLQLRVLGSQ
jgi:hypothetical protein